MPERNVFAAGLTGVVEGFEMGMRIKIMKEKERRENVLLSVSMISEMLKNPNLRPNQRMPLYETLSRALKSINIDAPPMSGNELLQSQKEFGDWHTALEKAAKDGKTFEEQAGLLQRKMLTLPQYNFSPREQLTLAKELSGESGRLLGRAAEERAFSARESLAAPGRALEERRVTSLEGAREAGIQEAEVKQKRENLQNADINFRENQKATLRSLYGDTIEILEASDRGPDGLSYVRFRNKKTGAILSARDVPGVQADALKIKKSYKLSVTPPEQPLTQPPLTGQLGAPPPQKPYSPETLEGIEEQDPFGTLPSLKGTLQTPEGAPWWRLR